MSLTMYLQTNHNHYDFFFVFLFRRGFLAIRQIRKFQKSTELLIPRLSFQRLVRSVTKEQCRDPENQFKFKAAALEALQVIDPKKIHISNAYMHL